MLAKYDSTRMLTETRDQDLLLTQKVPIIIILIF